MEEGDLMLIWSFPICNSKGRQQSESPVRDVRKAVLKIICILFDFADEIDNKGVAFHRFYHLMLIKPAG